MYDSYVPPPPPADMPPPQAPPAQIPAKVSARAGIDYKSFMARPPTKIRPGLEGWGPKMMGIFIILGLLLMCIGAIIVNFSYPSSDPYDSAVQHDPDTGTTLHPDHADEYHQWVHDKTFGNAALKKGGYIVMNLGFMFVAMALLVGGVANQAQSDWIRIVLIIMGCILLISIGFSTYPQWENDTDTPIDPVHGGDAAAGGGGSSSSEGMGRKTVEEEDEGYNWWKATVAAGTGSCGA